MKRNLLLGFGVLCMAALLGSNATAQTYLYWDNNGLSAPTSGTWDLSTPAWASDANPTASPAAWDGTSAAVFAVNAGSGNWSTFNLTVDSAVNIGGIYNNGLNGSAPVTNVVFTGSGSLNINSGVVISVGNGSIGAGSGNNNIFRVPITGNGSVTFQSAVGSEYLSVPNTYSGGTTIDSVNGINFAASNPFGSGLLTLVRTTTVFATPANDPTATPFANGSITIPNDVVANTTNTSTIIYVGNASAPATFTGNWNMGSQNQTLDFRNGTLNAPATISGIISGSGQLTKSGNGFLVLSGNNTYSGKTVIGNGVLSVSSLNSVSGGSASSSLGHPTTTANGTINLGATTTAGSIYYTGAGETTDRIINLSGTTGGGAITNDGAGALVFTSDFTATGSGAKVLTLSGANTGNNTISGKIVDSAGGATSVTKNGAGKWILNGVNTYSGTTTLSAGTLGIGNASALGIGTFAINGGSYDNTSGSSITMANAITFGGNSTFVGSANLTLGGAATLSGSRTLTITANTLTLDGVVGESGGARKLTKAGNGTLTLNKANTFTGGFQINAGTVKVANNSALGTGLLTLNGGTFQSDSAAGRTFANNVTQSANTTIGGSGALTFNGTSYTVSGGNRTLTVNNSADTTISGSIIEDGSARKFTKAGTGKLILSGVSTNTGGTQVSAGTLALIGSGALGAGDVTVSSGAILDASGRTDGTLAIIAGQSVLGGGTIIGNTTIAGALRPGTSAGLLTFNNDLTLGAASQTFIEIGGSIRGTDFDAVNVGQKFTLDGTLTISFINTYAGEDLASYQLFQAGQFAGNFQDVVTPTFSNGWSWDLTALPTTGVISIVPEPSSLALVFCGLVGLLARRARRS